MSDWLIDYLTDWLTDELADWLTSTSEVQKVAKHGYFVHVHLQLCFALQRRAIFRHQNFQKCSETVSFLAFWLGNVLRATAACNFSTIFRHRNFQKCFGPEVFCTFSLWNVLFATAARDFSTSELQKVLRTWGVLYIFTSKCAFRHSGMQFLISPLTTWLRTRRFNRPTFRLTGHTDHWKTLHFATSLTFGADVSSFFWLSHYCIFLLLSWLLYYCAFHLLFNSPYCRKFLSKLPSTIWQNRFKSIQKPCLNPQTRFGIPYPPISNSWLKPHPIHNPNF